MPVHPVSIESAGGEYMESVLVVSWAARPGDRVKAGQLLVVVETAKAATEIEADRDGWLAEVFFQEGQEAPVGAVLGTISDVEPEAGPSAPQRAAQDSPVAGRADRRPASEPAPGRRVLASPLARRVAAEAGLDLAVVAGSGPRGRIKQRDVLAHLADGGARSAAAVATPARPHPAPARGREETDLLVLLHGFGADRSAWRQVTPLLPRAIAVVALDLPGHGTRAAVAAPTIEDIALDISAQLDAAGIERAHLAGHSLGAAAALSLAALGRVAVRSLSLLAPAGLGPEINHRFLSGLTRATTPEALQRWLSVMVANEAVLPPGYAKAALRQLDRQGNREVLESLAAGLFPGGTQAFDLVPILARLQMPARILWGRCDRVIPPAHAARAPGGVAVHMLDGVGHTAQMEAPALVARLLAETVRSAD